MVGFSDMFVYTTSFNTGSVSPRSVGSNSPPLGSLDFVRRYMTGPLGFKADPYLFGHLLPDLLVISMRVLLFLNKHRHGYEVPGKDIDTYKILFCYFLQLFLGTSLANGIWGRLLISGES